MRARARLEADFDHFRRHLEEFPDRQHLVAESHWFSSDPRQRVELQASAMDWSGRPLAGAPPFDWPSEMLARAREAPAHGSVTAQGRSYRVLVGPARVGSSSESVLIGIARDNAGDATVLLHFRAAALTVWVVASLAAGALGYFAVRRALRPVGRMAEAAARIGAESLHERLDVRDAPLELHELALSFNAMLERLERSFRRLADFSSDLAHELRSPLNSLMLQAQVALGRPRSEAELRHVLESGLEELERLSRMANDMLFIAKAEHAGHLLRLEPVPLEEESGKVFEYFEALAAERGVHLALSGAACARADRSLIRRMLVNLVSNAVRHAERGSTVEVACGARDPMASLAVTNVGPGLTEADCERVFDRFFRVGSSRGTEGVGLGLAIVKSIAELHGGRVGARSSGARTTFWAELPAMTKS